MMVVDDVIVLTNSADIPIAKNTRGNKQQVNNYGDDREYYYCTTDTGVR